MKSIRNRHLILSDTLLLLALPILLYALRFEGQPWGEAHRHTAFVYTLLVVPLSVATFFAFGLYRRLWRYGSVAELELIFAAGAVAAVNSMVLGGVALTGLGLVDVRVPLSVLFANALCIVAAISGPRLALRLAGGRAMVSLAGSQPVRRVLIAGAGTAGQLIVRELRTNARLGMQPIGFVDDDATKLGHRLSDVPVLGILADIPRLVRMYRVDSIIIAMPSAPGSVLRQVVRAAAGTGAATQTIPGISEILSGRVNVAALREVEIQDLLRREAVRTDLTQVGGLCTGRTVLVTGAGGSIGSELCRQVSALSPERMVLLGHGENSIFDILQELRGTHPHVEYVPVIADIRDRDRIRWVVSEYRPFAIFHAAAHKHVPLMEDNVLEAVTNNVAGTRNVVEAAAEAEVRHFVLISTDKAVRPTSIMGATKRIAEYVVRATAVRHQRRYVAVRFGNVLGSRGSVVPMFMRQIRAGGPVTVTHPEMRRYFMTIPEAVQLVLQAGALGTGGELFMLDMGEPVKIVELARDLIRLSGLQEGTDIEIRFTGMRPGEKLYEEMFFDHEVASQTAHPKILRADQDHGEQANQTLIDDLIALAEQGGTESEIRVLLRCLVPDFTYHQTQLDHETVMASTPEAETGASSTRALASAGDALGPSRQPAPAINRNAVA